MKTEFAMTNGINQEEFWGKSISSFIENEGPVDLDGVRQHLKDVREYIFDGKVLNSEIADFITMTSPEILCGVAGAQGCSCPVKNILPEKIKMAIQATTVQTVVTAMRFQRRRGLQALRARVRGCTNLARVHEGDSRDLYGQLRQVQQSEDPNDDLRRVNMDRDAIRYELRNLLVSGPLKLDTSNPLMMWTERSNKDIWKEFFKIKKNKKNCGGDSKESNSIQHLKSVDFMPGTSFFSLFLSLETLPHSHIHTHTHTLSLSNTGDFLFGFGTERYKLVELLFPNCKEKNSFDISDSLFELGVPVTIDELMTTEPSFNGNFPYTGIGTN